MFAAVQPENLRIFPEFSYSCTPHLICQQILSSLPSKCICALNFSPLPLRTPIQPLSLIWRTFKLLAFKLVFLFPPLPHLDDFKHLGQNVSQVELPSIQSSPVASHLTQRLQLFSEILIIAYQPDSLPCWLSASARTIFLYSLSAPPAVPLCPKPGLATGT